MDWNPPPGSNISVATDGADPTIIIPNSGSALRYFHCAFLLFWLGMWAIGLKQAASLVLSGKADSFVIFWLGGWTVGGFFAVSALYRMLRPTVPELLELRNNSVAYDSGIAPLQFDSSWRAKKPREVWSSVFPKRIRVEFDRGRLQSLRLRETETGNRLTIDVDAARIEIAAAASEVEREWLARLLAQRYGISQVSAAPAKVSAAPAAAQ